MIGTPVTGTAKSNPKSTDAHARDIDAARRVFRLEADALGMMSEALDENFVRAVDFIDNAQGRTVVTGMGKSGHIARKIRRCRARERLRFSFIPVKPVMAIWG